MLSQLSALLIFSDFMLFCQLYFYDTLLDRIQYHNPIGLMHDNIYISHSQVVPLTLLYTCIYFIATLYFVCFLFVYLFYSLIS